jgi:hypothetical protein
VFSPRFQHDVSWVSFSRRGGRESDSSDGNKGLGGCRLFVMPNGLSRNTGLQDNVSKQ